MWFPRVVVAAGLVLGAWTGSAPDDLLQARVAAIDHRRETLQLDVYLAGTTVPRATWRAALVPFDGRTRFRPPPGGADRVGAGDDVLVRVGRDGRATEVTLVDPD